MGSMNRAILIGRVGKDPEIRYTQTGDAVASASLATSETWKDKAGDKQEKTEWHRLVFWRRTAEVVGEYVKKGDMIAVEGKLTTRKWQDKDGNDRYTTEIVCDKLVILSSKRDGGDEPRAAKPRPASTPETGFDDMDDDIPL